MEQMKLFDSELKLMELLWSQYPVQAKDLARLAEEQTGWNKNTTYTILKKLVEKGVVARSEPNFTCTPLLMKEQVQRAETETLINKLFNGSRKTFFAAFLQQEKLSEQELQELKDLIEKSGG